MNKTQALDNLRTRIMTSIEKLPKHKLYKYESSDKIKNKLLNNYPFSK